MPKILLTTLLLCASNTMMAFAWYGHLRMMKGRPVILAILASWAIAFFEYCLAVPANRIGSTAYSCAKACTVAGLCILGAVFFIFRKPC